MSPFNWQGQPSAIENDRAFTGPRFQGFAKTTAARNAGLVDPSTNTPKGAISIGKSDPLAASKRTKLMRAAI